jgi:hypothetical protein
MDVSQALVFRMSHVIPAVDDVLRRWPLEDPTCLATREASIRLAAYELMARREVLDYNPVLTTTDGHMYVSMRPSHPWPGDASIAATNHNHNNNNKNKNGFPILRASPLAVVAAVMDGNRQAHAIVGRLVACAPQRQCCWYSVDLQKACPAPAIAFPTDRPSPYVFCIKHWNPMLRQGRSADGEERGPGSGAAGAITPSSEQDTDDWLASIV